jgi:hypothetical protein
MEKVFRDPVHSMMGFDREEERLVLELIETREVQRLREIRLLGVGYFSYPGAEHSRFAHSLGTAYLMKRAIERIESLGRERQFHHVAKEIGSYKELLIVTALLHDLGHFPLSHLLEEYVGEPHETWTIKIILDPQTEVHHILKEADPEYPRRIEAILERRFKPSFAVKLISSQLDVDRMDYLLRDSLYTGARYGNFDIDWLIHSLRIIEVDGDYELALDRAKGSRVAEEYILARYYMYQQVYHHKRSRAAGAMVRKVLARAAELLREDKTPFVTEPLRRLLVDRGEFTVRDHLELDDVVLMFAIRQWAESPDPILRDLCRRLLRGRIFATLEIDLRRYLELQEELHRLAAKRGFDPEYYLEIDSASDNPYTDAYLVGERVGVVPPNIFLVDDGGLVELSTVSELIAAIRNKEIGTSRLCFPEELGEEITGLVHPR